MTWRILVRSRTVSCGGRGGWLEHGAEAGRELRKVVPRSSHAVWDPAGRPSPLRPLEETNRHRGARAGPDPGRPHAGLAVRVPAGRAGGDGPRPVHHPGHRDHRAGLRRRPPAQLRAVRHPERNLSFGLNDFDETLPAPGSGTSSGWPSASWSPGGRSGSTRRCAAGRPWPWSVSTASRWPGTPGCGCWRCGTRGSTRPRSWPWPGGGGGGRWPGAWTAPSTTPTWTPCRG
jgi:hypothetical protein